MNKYERVEFSKGWRQVDKIRTVLKEMNKGMVAHISKEIEKVEKCVKYSLQVKNIK